MRYVIVIVALAMFLIWDGLKNDGQYLEDGVRMVRYLFRMLGV